ncbi:hypothetical protein KQX54_000018, partial [Cotesia glomerata]
NAVNVVEAENIGRQEIVQPLPEEIPVMEMEEILDIENDRISLNSFEEDWESDNSRTQSPLAERENIVPREPEAYAATSR